MDNASNCTCWNAAAKEVTNVKKCNIGKVEGDHYETALIRSM